MMRLFSTRLHFVPATLCLLLFAIILDFRPLIADDAKDAKKLTAEIRTLVKRLATSKHVALEKISDRFVELDGQGIPVKQVLCEVIANQSGSAVQNALTVLENVAPSTADCALKLISPGQGSSLTHAQVFDYYESVFANLAKVDDIDPAVAPILTVTLLNLAKLGNRAGTSATSTPNDASYEKRSDVYESGVLLLSRLARDDDEALGYLLRLVALEIRTTAENGELHLRDEAVKQVGRATGKQDTKRADRAIPVIVKALNTAMSPPKGPLTPLEAFGTQIGSFLLAESALNSIGEIGPNAAAAAPAVRQLQNHPRLGGQAARVLMQIGG